MVWLKKQQPVKLYQGSDLPYVILDDGVRLCFDNCYGQKLDKFDHNISFVVQANALRRINTYFYRLNPFPATIPFSDIITLDDAIIAGRTIKHNSEVQRDSQKLAIVQSEYIPLISDVDLSNLNNQLEHFDHSFILVGESIDPQVRLFDDVATILHHSDWYRTMVSVIDRVCAKSNRKYCWTKSVPELGISYYGTNGSGDISKLNDAAEYIGLDTSIEWAG